MDKELAACFECADVAVKNRTLICKGCNASVEHVYCKDHGSAETSKGWHCKDCCSSLLLSYSGVYQHEYLHNRIPRDHIQAVDTKNKIVRDQLPSGYKRTGALCDSATELLLLPSIWGKKARRGSNTDPNNQPPIPVTENPLYNPWASLLRLGPEYNNPVVFTPVKNKKKGADRPVSQSLRVRKPSTERPRRTSERLAGKKYDFHEISELGDLEEDSKLDNLEETVVLYDLCDVEKYPSNIPNLEATWKGRFKILGSDDRCQIHGSFQAHPPARPYIVDNRVHLFLNQMPKILEFTMLPCSEIWGEIFSSDFASGNDISLYFFPKNAERSIMKYACLIAQMEEEDFALRSCVNGIELFVFVSKRLRHAEELKWVSFLWGIFLVENDENDLEEEVLEIPELEKPDDETESPPGFYRKYGAESPSVNLVDISPDSDETPQISSDLVEMHVINDTTMDRKSSSESLSINLVDVPVTYDSASTSRYPKRSKRSKKKGHSKPHMKRSSKKSGLS